MTTTTTPTYRATVTVDAPIERAFKVFTEGFDTWWPRTHHIGASDMTEAILEQRREGRWYERDADGSECDWGRVLAWDPPRHLALSWQIDAEFRHEPDADKASRVDVHFEALDANSTRVELVHSELDRHGDAWQKLHTGISGEGGWSGLLDLFALAAA